MPTRSPAYLSIKAKNGHRHARLSPGRHQMSDTLGNPLAAVTGIPNSSGLMISYDHNSVLYLDIVCDEIRDDSARGSGRSEVEREIVVLATVAQNGKLLEMISHIHQEKSKG
jgi:hypothetical protein